MLGLDDPCLDPEFAEPEPIVGLELDHGAGQQRQTLAAGVLEQVAGELRRQRLLVGREPLAVTRRQEDPVLVGDDRARDREGLVLLHLPRELARDLDRTHLRAEGTAERAFDEAGDLAFEASENAHGRALTAVPCYGSSARNFPLRRERQAWASVGLSARSPPAIAPAIAPGAVEAPAPW